MSDKVTVVGLIATTPRVVVTEQNQTIASFRLATSDDAKNTNWYTVSVFDKLASNAGISLSKGDRIIVTGKLRVRDWDNGERSGTTIEIEAETIGHDLNYGTSRFERTIVGALHKCDCEGCVK